MTAAIRTQYCEPEGIQVQEVNTPAPGPKEILIRVHASTVNRTDMAILRGKPFIMRLFTGLSRPKLPITGTDFAGVVEATGSEVTLWQPGERVWGFNDLGLSSHATHICLHETANIASIPDDISFSEAAASAEGAHYALNFYNKVNIAAGQNALVYGASGAIGSALVQQLKAQGLDVTAVGPTEYMESMKTLGADHWVDFRKTDFTRLSARFDYVFDAVGKSTFGACKPLLKPKGIYISSEPGPWAQHLFLPMITGIRGGKRVIFPFPSDIPATLGTMNTLLSKGQFHPLIDRTFPLEQISEAFQYVATGKKMGNVVIQIK